MLLYDHPLSSYAQKVKIALREKGLAFERRLPEDFGTGRQGSPFSAANPRSEVPALVDGAVNVFDSTIILEYIEDRWPEPALLPQDPALRARARMIEEVCDTQYEAVNWGFGEVLWFRRAEGALADKLKDAAARDTRRLQGWLEAQLGTSPWFGGAGFGWAGLAAAPMVNRSIHYGLGPAPGSLLATWRERIGERSAVAVTFEEFEAAAAAMAGAAESYRSGERRREYRDHRLEWMIRSGGAEVVEEGLRAGNIRFSWPWTPDDL